MTTSSVVRVYDGFVKVDRAPNGYERVVTTDSVAVLIYDPTSQKVIFTSQVRFPMLETIPIKGDMVEVVAGRLDTPFYDVRGTVVKEIAEEIGVEIETNQVEIVSNKLATSPGVLTEMMWLAYVELKPGQIDVNHNGTYGNSHENEETQRAFCHVDDLYRLVDELHDLKTWALIQWFLRNKHGKGNR